MQQTRKKLSCGIVKNDGANRYCNNAGAKFVQCYGHPGVCAGMSAAEMKATRKLCNISFWSHGEFIFTVAERRQKERENR